MDIKTRGFKELEQAMQELTSAGAKGVMRRSLLKAAQPMADTAKAMAPDDPATGGFDLKKSIIAGTKLSRAQAKAHRKMFRDDRAAVEVFVGPGPLPQAVQQEFGNVNHAPQPFMRPAFDQDAGPLVDRLGNEMAAELTKAVGRARRKALKG
jgi:HK97 gp10 family phage protein